MQNSSSIKPTFMTDGTGLDTGRSRHEAVEVAEVRVAVTVASLHNEKTYALSHSVRAALGLKDGESLLGELPSITKVAERLVDGRVGQKEIFATLGQLFPHSDYHDHVDAIMGAAHAQPRFEAPPPYRSHHTPISRHN
ncbi:MAG: hypothetical protein WC101_00040 [Candidatus Gracilibacteria bacterium]